jgi:hypothetical protein
MLMDALRYIVGLAQPPVHVVAIDGNNWVHGEIKAPPEHRATTLQLSTLEGLVDYLRENRDGLELASHLVHIESPSKVKLLGQLSQRLRQRETVLLAEAQLPTLVLGSFIDREQMQIQLQTMFEQNGDRDDLLKVVGNIEAGEVRTVTDDGMSQQVVLRKHAASVERETVKRVVTLAPFRTFHEVEQPTSDFVFRVRQRDEQIPTVALFEADGGEWRRYAVEGIFEYLKSHLEDLETAPALLR